MKITKNPLMFFVALITVLTPVASAIIMVPHANAYSIESSGTPLVSSETSTGQRYDVNSSFQNLVSPFTQFINSLKWNTDISITGNGLTNTQPSVTTNINYQTSLHEFETWFHTTTGVNATGAIMFIENSFGWIFGWADGAVQWIASHAHP